MPDWLRDIFKVRLIRRKPAKRQAGFMHCGGSVNQKRLPVLLFSWQVMKPHL
jgi:hypothetical protein